MWPPAVGTGPATCPPCLGQAGTVVREGVSAVGSGQPLWVWGGLVGGLGANVCALDPDDKCEWALYPRAGLRLFST